MVEKPRGTVKTNRSHWDNIRAALQYMNSRREPVPYTRLLFVCQSTPLYLPSILNEMEYHGLIKVSVVGYPNTTRRTYAITQKGRKVLELLDAQAALMSKAPWILENTQ